ncbi:MAG: Fpg/Nei family DNA glycosylase [Puniceicoccaceae bacterium]
MPELAEVEYYRKQWSPGIGQRVNRVRVHPKARIYRDSPARMLQSGLKGTRLEHSEAHGKQMCFRFSGGCWLGVHLGMSGHLQTAAPEIVPARHEHLVLVMEDVALVLEDPRMFGKVLFHKGEAAPAWWDNLPPQPQDAAFDRARLRGILKRHPRRPLKALLLDQQAFPGIGNWMADEILWRSRIHPAATANSLSPWNTRRLFEIIKAVAEDAMAVIGTDWGDPPDDWLFNHRWRKGGVCPVSGKPLVYETIGGRTTCYSPAIQKEKR